MHDIRIRQTVTDGEILWCAEDDLGLFAGAPTLAELKPIVREWAEAEGLSSEEYRMCFEPDLDEHRGQESDEGPTEDPPFVSGSKSTIPQPA